MSYRVFDRKHFEAEYSRIKSVRQPNVQVFNHVLLIINLFELLYKFSNQLMVKAKKGHIHDLKFNLSNFLQIESFLQNKEILTKQNKNRCFEREECIKI